MKQYPPPPSMFTTLAVLGSCALFGGCGGGGDPEVADQQVGTILVANDGAGSPPPAASELNLRTFSTDSLAGSLSNSIDAEAPVEATGAQAQDSPVELAQASPSARVMAASAVPLPSVDIQSQRVAPHSAGLLLGVHSLWWGMTAPYYANGNLAPVLRNLFASTGGVMRFGGAANEADWSMCGNELTQRSAAKVVTWAGAMRCDYGWSEYLNSTLNQGKGNAWMIANVVGNASGEYSESTLDSQLRTGASRLAQLAHSANRTWELGNELERGAVNWGPEKMAARLKLAAKSLRGADPQATLVFPLTEYDPPNWSRKAFNDTLLKNAAGNFTDFALHQYYEGAKGGPRVSTQLMVVREAAAQIEQHIGKGGGLWLTEHGRWPAGLPEDKGWEANWWLTNSMSGTRATADYLIGLSQIPAVKGAMLHGVRAGPWNIVANGSSGPYLTGVGKLLQLFGQSGAKFRLRTATTGAEFPVDWAGYLGRVAAFETGTSGEYVIWGVNNGATSFNARLTIGGLNRQVDVLDAATLACPKTEVECSTEKVILSPQTANRAAYLRSSSAETVLTLPANTVFTLRLRLR